MEIKLGSNPVGADGHMRGARFASLIGRNGCWAVVVAVAVVVGRATRIDDSDISLVWPAAAVSSIWMLRSRRGADAVVGAVALVVSSAVATYLTGASLATSIGFSLVNLMIGGLTALLVTRRGRLQLREPGDLAWLLTSVAASTGVAAVAGGVLIDVLLGGPMWQSTMIFWMRNGVTVLMGLTLLSTAPTLRRRWTIPGRRQLVGDVAVWAGAVGAYAAVFVVNDSRPLAFFLLPVTVMLGLRWATAVSVWHMLASDVFVLIATAAHRGPFISADPVLRGALAQGFIGCTVVVVLTVALFRDDRERLLHELAQAHRETQGAADQLLHASLHDSLTGLANRQRLTNVLTAELDRRGESHVGVLFIDLDGFKAINDGFGHAEGDLLLDAVGTRLRTLSRAGDTVARLGGDEFVMVCPSLTVPGQLAPIADRVASALGQPYQVLSGRLHTGVSASVGTAVSSAITTPSELLRDADTDMYARKKAKLVLAAGGSRFDDDDNTETASFTLLI